MSLSDYSSMEQEIRNAPEPKVLPKGSEVKARIISVNTGVSEKQKSYGARWYMPLFDVPDDPIVKEFNTFIWDPLDHGKIDPKQAARNADIFNKFRISSNDSPSNVALYNCRPKAGSATSISTLNVLPTRLKTSLKGSSLKARTPSFHTPQCLASVSISWQVFAFELSTIR